MSLVNSIFQFEAVPTSIYHFHKIFEDSKPKKHFFCENCQQHLDQSNEATKESRCKCGYQNNLQSQNNYFLSLSTESQLESIVLENASSFFSTFKLGKTKSSKVVSDVTDSELYLELLEDGKIKRNQTITLTFNTDGAQTFASQSKSLWSIQMMVNELPPTQRFKRKILSSLGSSSTVD